MQHFNFFREYILNETLGVNKDVMDFSNILYAIIQGDIQNNKNKNKIKLYNNLGIDSISIEYFDDPSKSLSTVSTKNNDIFITVNTNTPDKELLSVINHELLHAYSELKGYNQEDEYKKLIKLSNLYDVDDGYTGRLIYILYFFSRTEMNSMIQELWVELKNNNINNKKEFNKYVLNHMIYSNIKYVGQIDLKNIWNKIISENTDQFLINELKIKNIDKWILKKEKYLKEQAKDFKKRIFRMSELFDRNF